MASYIEGALIKDEKVICTGKVSPWSEAPLIILGGLFLAIGGLGLIFGGLLVAIWGVCGLGLILIVYIRLTTTELAFTNKRVIAKIGFISRQTVELNISKVESIQVDQGILGRICNFGTLVISGAGTPQAPIKDIANPMAFRRAFMEYQDNAAEKKV